MGLKSSLLGSLAVPAAVRLFNWRLVLQGFKLRIHFDWWSRRFRILLDPFSDQSDLGFGILQAGRDGHDVVDEVGDDRGVVALVHGPMSLGDQGFQVFVRRADSNRSWIFVVALDDFCIGRRFSVKIDIQLTQSSISLPFSLEKDDWPPLCCLSLAVEDHLLLCAHWFLIGYDFSN